MYFYKFESFGLTNIRKKSKSHPYVKYSLHQREGAGCVKLRTKVKGKSPSFTQTSWNNFSLLVKSMDSGSTNLAG